MEDNRNSSVSDTVNKFEASKIVHRTPLDPPPVIVKLSKKPTGSPPLPPVEPEDAAELGPPPPVPPTPPPDDTELDMDNQQVTATKEKSSTKKAKKTKSLEKPAVGKKEPDLSQVPRKSSLKKSRSKSYLEVKLPGLWFNMDDQYPVENFFGREGILDSIHNVVHGQKSRDARPISRAIVLVGKSGMGKTEIARKFAFKFYVDSNGEGNVVWLDGSSRNSIIQTLLRLHEKELKGYDHYEQYASTPEIPTTTALDNNNSKETRKSGVSSRKKNKETNEEDELLNEKIQRILRHRIFQENHTLFIFDNAKGEEDIIEFLPNLSPVGHIPSILVTSLHSHNWNNARVFQVNEFDFKEAVDFLSNNLQSVPGFTRFQAEDLAKELHRFPKLLQRVQKRMTDSQNEASDWALARLEKNISLVRRLKAEGVIRSKTVEIAALSIDRSHFSTEDPYIEEYDNELRTHPVSMLIHRVEELVSGMEESADDVAVLAVNENPYVLALLAFVHRHIKVVAAYGSEHSRDEIEMMKMQINFEGVTVSEKVQFRLLESSAKAKQPKIAPLLEKLRSIESKVQYDLISTPLLDEVDLKPVKRLLKPGGRLVTTMSSTTVGQVLKKTDSKKLCVRIKKHDFPELLVTATKL